MPGPSKQKEDQSRQWIFSQNANENEPHPLLTMNSIE